MNDWQEGFKEAVVRLVVRQGHPANVERGHLTGDLSLDVYQPFAFSDERKAIEEHLAVCQTVGGDQPEVRTFSWSQFEDTFSDNSEHEGVGAKLTCVCGKVRDVWFVVEGTLGEILEGLLFS